MQLTKTTRHPDVSPVDISLDSDLTLITRHTARGIILRDENILLLYTQRYDDYSLPSGSTNEGDENISGLIRELQKK